MGDDIQSWRARIGLFNCGSVSILNGSGFWPLGGVNLLPFLTLCYLLVIGCVELNPGPDYKCLKCPSQPTFCTLSESALHQKLHINDKNFRFSCQAAKCGLTFLSFSALNVHISRCHFRHIPLASSFLKCNVSQCGKEFPSCKLLCNHLSSEHHSKGLPTQCPFKDKCKSSHYFSSTFAVHLSQYHPGWRTSVSLGALKSREESAATSDFSMDYADNDDDFFMDAESGDGPDASIHTCNGEDESEVSQMKSDFYRLIAMFYLGLEAQHLIPVTTIDIIANGLAHLTEASLLIVKETIKKEFNDLKLTDQQKEISLNNILSSDCLYAAHHKDVHGPCMCTNDLRKSHFKSLFKYVTPVELNLSKDPKERKCIYYVPIKDHLSLALSDPDIEEEIENSFTRESQPGLIQDYKDGSLYKERKRKHPEKTIDLLVFQDAFTPTKDLSSAANLYQILGMYMTIGNLRPHLRSKLSCIYLIMLIPNFKEMFGNFKQGCFEEVKEQLKKLEEEGILFKEEKVRVQVQYLIGDNKGQHEIGGFIQSFSSEYYCRYCEMTKSQILKEPWKVGPLRTPASYEEAANSVPDGRATFKGVSRSEWKCPFNELKDFHVCDPSLAPCIGHDLFEGIIVYDMNLIIKHLVVEKKWFSYEVLNRCIKRFKYRGHDSGNKPAQVRYKKKKEEQKNSTPNIGGHAVQNWTLLRLLPLIVGDELIKDPEDSYWKLYLLLKKITELLCGPTISLNMLSLVKILIEDYEVLRQDLLGDGKPKHHYLAHYPDLIEIMGPLIHLMTLRFEHFHQFFKKVARSSNNFINLGFTMINRYCLFSAYLAAGSPIVKGISVPDGVPIALQLSAVDDDALISAVNSMDISDQASVVRSAVVDENCFKEEDWLLLKNFDDCRIVTGQVKFIILTENAVFLVLKHHLSQRIDAAGIYEIDPDHFEISCVSVKDLNYPIVHSVYEWGEHKICFALKYSLAF